MPHVFNNTIGCVTVLYKPYSDAPSSEQRVRTPTPVKTLWMLACLVACLGVRNTFTSFLF